MTVPIYVYRCECGLRFERLLPRDAAAPECPECGGATRKIPAGAGLGGRAGDRPAQGGVAPQLRGLQTGGPERLRREVEFRQRLAAKDVSKQASSGGSGADGGQASTPPPTSRD
jgi:putative FmdB family regulatory protein